MRLPRFLSRIVVRLLAFNVLLVFVPVAGLLYVDTYERQLLEAQERSMVQQGRIFAAALSERGQLDPASVERILISLSQQQTARLRIVDHRGVLLADSSRLGPRLEPGEVEEEPEGGVEESWLYRLGASSFRFLRSLGPPTESSLGGEYYSSHRPLDGQEVIAALGGRYGAATRRSTGQRSVTLYSALPIETGDDVVGVVLVSQSTLSILQNLYEVRLDVFRTFLASLGVAVVLSLIVATTIVRPVSRLRGEANDFLDYRGRPTGGFRGSRRNDEIGDLARALEKLSDRLGEHVSFIEGFAADVSHEFKNPLASIRAATELLSDVEEPAERQRFISLVEREVARMERLLTAAREVTLIDARLGEEERELVELDRLLEAVAEAASLRSPESVRLEYRALPAAAGISVSVSPDRLTQVVDNLLDNAYSFAPGGSAVTLTLGREGCDAVIAVEDSGPGIPPEHRERVFSRFFSYRPDGDGGQHAGLGLSIVRAIVEGYGGRVLALGRSEGGSRFEVRLPEAGT